MSETFLNPCIRDSICIRCTYVGLCFSTPTTSATVRLVRPIIIIGSRDDDFCLFARDLLAQEGFEAVLMTGQPDATAAACIRKRSHTCSADTDSPEQRSAFVPARVLCCLCEEASGALKEQKAHTRLSCGDIEMDASARRVWRTAIEVHLPRIEFEILRSFLREPDRVFLRQELIAMAWPPGVFVDPKTVSVHVGRLRRALARTSSPDPIRTVRGVGYALAASGLTSA